MRPRQRIKTIALALSIGALAVLLVFTFKLYPQRQPQGSEITIATGTPGGTYYVLGDQLARILEQSSGKFIKSATAVSSAGSLASIQRLVDSEATVAFAQSSALMAVARESPALEDSLRVLSRLYTDVVHVAVRKNNGIETITDLKDKTIFVGPERSGTRLIALHVLETTGLAKGDYRVDRATTYDEAADRLIRGDLDAALFAAGTPTPAVQDLLADGRAELLSLDEDIREQLTNANSHIGLSKTEIPPNFYRNQPNRIRTVGTDVFLACRRDLSDKLAFAMLEALFDNIVDLLLAHTQARDIRLTRAFKDVPERYLHPGAEQFKKQEERKLRIATGAVNEKYYHLGRMIALLLNERKISARVIQTDGSLENAELLGESERPTIAIMQYDAALAARFGKSRLVYDSKYTPEGGFPFVGRIRRLAVLHDERVHVLLRRDKLKSVEEKLSRMMGESESDSITTLRELADAMIALSPRGEKIRVSLGGERSGTRAVAEAILEHHGFEQTAIARSFLSVHDMVDRLHSGEIDAGFYVSYVPGEAIKTILNDRSIRLLSLGHKERAQMPSAVFRTSAIESGEYASQELGEAAIQTIATKAVLAATADLKDAHEITKAVFEGAAFLGMDKTSLAEDLPSLPLHEDAERYYREVGLRPSKPARDWLGMTWTILAILVVLVGGYQGVIRLRRDRTTAHISRKILAVPIQSSDDDSVTGLLGIRDEIQERLRKTWWRPGQLDKPRWRSLDGMIEDRIKEARENLTRGIVAEIRAVVDNTELDEVARGERYQSMEHRVWAHFEKGELDSSQHGMICELLKTAKGQDGAAELSPAEKMGEIG